MTRYQKMLGVNNELQALPLTKDIGFFRKALPEKITELLPLTIIDSSNPKFKIFMEDFRDMIYLAIDF